MADFVAKFREPSGFSFKFGVGSAFPVIFGDLGSHFKLKFSDCSQSGTVDAEVFEGDYIVTPKVTAQILATAQKLMRENVQIKEIPYFVVENEAGGDTVNIASEIVEARLGKFALGEVIL
jgi:hypothetical protein